MILEDLGPSFKVEGLPSGDYLVEITEPEDWTREVYGEDGSLRFKFVQWPLSVLEPADLAGRRVPHSTMYWASQEAISGAKKPYDPKGMTYQFLADIGVANRRREGGDIVIEVSPAYATKNGVPDLNKMIGHVFWVSYEDQVGKDGVTRRQVTKAWPMA